jgi:hypothetical protein
VLDERDIVVTMPEAGFRVTYRKEGDYRVLVATDVQRRDYSDPSKLEFLVEAWKLVHQRAKSLGWLRS